MIFDMKGIRIVLFIGILGLGISCQLSDNGLRPKDKPNIIYILADDLSYRDLSVYGQERFSTPHLDLLAINGVRFTQAYAAAPECAPSRGCLMTGLHTGHGPIRVNASARGGQENLRDEDLTIAEVLQEAGYSTGFAGKWGIGLPYTEGVPYKQGFDFSFGYYDQGRAHTFIPLYLWENDSIIHYPENENFDMPKRYNQRIIFNTYDEEGRLFIEELDDPYGFTYSDNEINKAAFRFLMENDPKKTGKPFFLYYATQLPHGPVIIPDLGTMQEPDSIFQKTREWAAMVMKLDSFVGELVAYLKEAGEYDNTVIFFSSDNGYSMCGYMNRGNMPTWYDDPWLKNKGPFTGGKFSALEGGIRIPFFVSWPAQFKPGIVTNPVWLPDFFPTAISLAGMNPDTYPSDGVNLLPVLTGQPADFEGHKYMYFSKQREQAIRMGPWKAYRKNPESQTRLYLIEEDTYSERDLALQYPEVIRIVDSLMDTVHEPHEWYWNPWETKEEFNEKRKKAVETGNKLPSYRPNGMGIFPWNEKASQSN